MLDSSSRWWPDGGAAVADGPELLWSSWSWSWSGAEMAGSGVAGGDWAGPRMLEINQL